jgi:Flp pilus assembly protein TadG
MLNFLYKLRQRGQAVVEMALAMPFLIWLIYYTLNAFYTIHTSHIAQKYSAMNLYQRLGNRSKIVVDDVEQKVVGRKFMAVQYMDPESNRLPERKINTGRNPVNNIVGICRERECD